jgi:glycosyltransferase involved in cell wall biosynthesis
MKKNKICFVVTVEYVVDHFLLSHLQCLSKNYDITLVLNSNQADLLSKRGIKATIYKIPFSRGIDFINDIYCFFKLFFFLKSAKFDAVHSVTPKVGLFAMLCSFLVGTPMRIHTFTGQIWSDKKGFRRNFFRYMDSMTAFFAKCCFVDSQSQMLYLIKNKVINENKSYVFGSGSISGVDLVKFKFDDDARRSVRAELSIPRDAFCLIFIGRILISKGVLDLLEAFSQIDNPKLFLMIVGPDESGIVKEIKEKYAFIGDRLNFVGYTHKPERYMSAADVLCLPSYKEGFGSVIIEAAAIGLPAIASNVYGITDAVINNQTGLLHEAKDVAGIRKNIELLFLNLSLFIKLSKNAQKRAIKEFSADKVSQYWLEFYLKHVH